MLPTVRATSLPDFASAALKSSTLLREGQMSLATGNAARALDCFELLLASGAQAACDFEFDALTGRAEAFCALGRTDDALATYHDIHLRHPETAAPLHASGKLLAQLERYDEALEKLDAALACKPNDPHILRDRGVALGHQGRLNDGLEALKRAREIAPTVPDFWFAEGSLLCATGKLGEGMEKFTCALKLDPFHQASLTQLAKAFLRTGNFSEALITSERALALDPSAPALVSLHAHALAGQGCLAVALGAFERALAIDPTHLQAMNGRTAVLLQLGRFDEALKQTEAASAWAGPSIAHLLLRAVAQTHLGLPHAAQASLDHAAERAPQDKRIAPLRTFVDTFDAQRKKLAAFPAEAVSPRRSQRLAVRA